MKNRLLQVLTTSIALVSACATARSDWAIHPASEFSEEERVWASAKEKGLDFSWSGRVNARHEAEGRGVLEWFKQDQSQRENELGLHWRNEIGPAPRHGRCPSPQRIEILRPVERQSQEWEGDYWYSNGDYYAGSFRNDVMHGPAGMFLRTERSSKEFLSRTSGRVPGRRIPGRPPVAATWSAGKDVDPSGAPASAKPYVMLGVDVRRYALDGEILGQGVGRGDEQYLTYRGRFTEGDLCC